MNKNNFLSVLLLCLFISIGNSTLAQLGVVNTRLITTSDYNFRKSDSLAILYRNQFAPKYNYLFNKYNTQLALVDSLKAIPANVTPATLSTALDSLNSYSLQTQTYQQQSNIRIEEYRDRLNAPFANKIIDAIKAVATKRKLMQVVDVSTINFLYINPTADITNEVMDYLKRNK